MLSQAIELLSPRGQARALCARLEYTAIIIYILGGE